MTQVVSPAQAETAQGAAGNRARAARESLERDGERPGILQRVNAKLEHEELAWLGRAAELRLRCWSLGLPVGSQRLIGPEETRAAP